MQVVVNIIYSSTAYLLISISFALVYFPTKSFYITHAAIITYGAYFTYFFIKKLHLPLEVVLPISIFVSSLLGVFFELLYRIMRIQSTSSISLLIASIGLYVVFQNGISLYFGNDVKVISEATIEVGHNIFEAYITTIQLVSVVISITLLIAIQSFQRYTAIGKSIRSVASNPELCKIYGISPSRIILIAVAIGSGLAGGAGILSAMDTNMTPTFGFDLLLYGVVAMIIGGVGSTWGLVGGSLLVATAQHLAAYYIDTKWMDAVTYMILILFLIWRPLGFSGKRFRKIEV